MITSDFVNFILEQRKTSFKINEIEDFKDSINLEDITRSGKEEDLFYLNTQLVQWNETLLQYFKIEFNITLPENISDAVKYVDDVEHLLQKKYRRERYINSYNFILKDLKSYILHKLEKEYKLDIYDFVINLEPEDTRENHLFLFENTYFDFLLIANYEISHILNLCSELWGKMCFEVKKFLKTFINENKVMSLDFFLNSKKFPTVNLEAEFLINLYESLNESKFYEELDIIENYNKTLLLEVFSRIDFNKFESANFAFEKIKPLALDDLRVSIIQTNVINNIINCSNSDELLKKECFEIYKEFIRNGSEEVGKNIFHYLSNINDNELEKYELLYKYISRFENTDIVPYFFQHIIEDPVYLFDYMMRYFSVKPDYSFSMGKLKSCVINSWNKRQNETEELILDLFRNPEPFGILGIKIILCTHAPLNIELLKLEKEEYQINAIKNYCKSPSSFEYLVDSLLKLRFSKHKKVREYLQKELSKKVFYSFQDILFDKIQKKISDSPEDKEFIEPIRMALNNYHELKKIKEKNNDLNPFENERDFMNLYYRLEHELKAEMLRDVSKGKGTFMEMLRNVEIVRGNSFKSDNKEILPLQKIESKVMLDKEAYKNPDLFEHRLYEDEY